MLKKKRIELDDSHGRSRAMEEFVTRIHQSTELLRNNRPEEARQRLEEAFDNQTDDPSGQATLASVYFKLGLYPRALAMYKKLLETIPDDPVLLLNTALVLFKTGQTDNARQLLEKVVGISPGYRKAYGYLGLAYQRLGEYARAQDAFHQAGVDHMANRMARFIEPDPHATISLETEESSSIPQDDDLPSIPPPPNGETRHSVPPPFHTALPITVNEPGDHPTEPFLISELVQQTRFSEPLDGRFLITSSGYLLVNVAQTVFSRLEGLHFCSSKGLTYTPTLKVFADTQSDQYLGPQADPVQLVEGVGKLGFHPRGQTFNAVSLNDDMAYLKEELVFAFDPDLNYQNGNIMEEHIPIVNFSGRGSIAFKSDNTLHSLEVTPDQGVIIPQDSLVGWFGRLLPHPTNKGPFSPKLNAVEFTGEGIILFCLPSPSPSQN